MNILLVTQNYHPILGGIETQARLIARKLAETHHVEVAAGNLTSARLPPRLGMLANNLLAPRSQGYQDDAVPVHALTPTLLDRARMLPIAARALPRAQRIAYHPLNRFGYRFYRNVYLPRLRRLARNADIVHVMAGGYIAWTAQEAARECGVPFVCTPYVHPHQWGDGPDDVACYKRADAVIGLLETDRKYLAALGVPAANLAVVGVVPILPPSAAPADFRQRHGIDDAPLVAFVGRMTEYKGVKAILEAGSAVWKRLPNTRFVFIGPPSEESAHWFAQADSRVLALGKVDDQEKADALAACDLFCMPSTSEILPAVYLEAWSYGKAVIGGKAEGLPELIEGCGGGVTVERAGAAVAQAITSLLLDAPLRDQMGQRGRELVQREYALQAVVGSLERLYCKLCVKSPQISV